jgi:preprotein translocase subunit SecD
VSSDYIPRLRAELVRAAERRRSPWRRFAPPLRPLVTAAVVGLLIVAVALAAGRGGDGSDELRFSAGGNAAERAAGVLRERFAAAGLSDATASVRPDGLVTIDVPADADAVVTALLRPGEFAIYDWETSVLGPDGRPAPDDEAVTGGASAGSWGALSRPEADARAAAAKEGALVVRAESPGPGRWYALGGEPALTSADIASAEPVIDPLLEQPAIAIEFEERGQDAFTELTRTIAQRGADAGVDQHFAMVFDGEILAVPYISYRENPDGIDGARGAQIPGFSGQTARTMAAMLVSGPLPAEFQPR